MKNILCVCAQGMNRSRFVANALKEQGFSTRHKGSTMADTNPTTQEDWDWADEIIFLTRNHQEFIHEQFGTKDKEFVLNVSDNHDSIPELWLRVRLEDPDKFYREFTFPRIREALKSVQQKL